MSFRTKFVLILISATLTLYTVVGGWISTRAQQPANDPNAQLRIFESVLQHIQNDYVDEPNMDKVRAGALRGLAYGLDPYSTYLTPEQVREYNQNGYDKQTGIGAELSQVASYLYVIAPMKGSPADQAGIRSGDIIEYIDGKATRDISLYDAKQLLNGAAGTEVKLRVLRANASPLTVSVKRSAFRAPSVEARMEAGRVGVLRINSFADGEAADAKARLQDLIKQGAQKVVIDLRDTAGGSLTEAVTVANLFIKDGVIAETVGREGKALKTFTADPKATLFSGPGRGLIDAGTAGAAEVVASAIAERNRGQVSWRKELWRWRRTATIHDLLRNRAFALANVAAFCLCVGRVVPAVVLSLWFQGYQGNNPVTAALKVTPLAVAVTVGTLAVGPVVAGRDDVVISRVTAAGAVTGSALLLAALLRDGDAVLFLVGLVVLGLSAGAFQTVNSTMILGMRPVRGGHHQRHPHDRAAERGLLGHRAAHLAGHRPPPATGCLELLRRTRGPLDAARTRRPGDRTRPRCLCARGGECGRSSRRGGAEPPRHALWSAMTTN